MTRAILDDTFEWGPDPRRITLLGIWKDRLIKEHPEIVEELRVKVRIGQWALFLDGAKA